MKSRSAFSRSTSGEVPSSAETQGGIPRAKPPSQVTFEGDVSEATTMTSTVQRPPSIASSPSRGLASSEEDSVAEMDYMSEGSNLSVNGILPPDSMEGDDVVQNIVPPRGPPAASSANGHSLSPGERSNDKSVVRAPLPFKTTTTSPAPRTESFRTLAQLQRHRNDVMLFTGSRNNNKSDSDSKLPAVTNSATSDSNRNINSSSGSNYNIDDDDDDDDDAIDNDDDHRPPCLPIFQDPHSCVWTASHAANCPTEDRSAMLVNLLLQPLPPNFLDAETQLPPLEPDYMTLIRLNLWCVVDGHGGGCVATYASEVLLPHIAASVSRALGCAIVDRGVCQVNGESRDPNALDLDGLITTSDRSLCNPNSIHYRSPFERSDSEEEGDDDDDDDDDGGDDDDDDDEGGAILSETDDVGAVPRTPGERKQLASLVGAANASLVTHSNEPEHGGLRSSPDDIASSMQGENGLDASVSSVKTSVKTAASPANREALVGTHSPREVAAITRAITESFLAVDEGWINSIDPVATHQNSCHSNGRWNSGACALVVFTIQRLDWSSVSEPDREKELRGPEKGRRNTSQNRDAARRRMLDYATRTKSASSMSTVSSTSSLTTEEAVNVSELESEITETEGEDDERCSAAYERRRNPTRSSSSRLFQRESTIKPPGSCSCHCYRAHDAMLYTAHVGDCRAVMLGSAPPRTIKVCDSNPPDTTDDESSHHSSDETECMSSSDHDADSSEEEDLHASLAGSPASAKTSSYMNFPRRVVRQKSPRRRNVDDSSGPFIALPPLEKNERMWVAEFDLETEICLRERRGREPSDSSSCSQESEDSLHLIHFAPSTRPIDLTTDHSAYNPAEVTAVLRRCNNAPRAISAGVGGGIKRVAGSLAVTRALGDAYLKTPLLSFLPYKSHAPYITARPEVNCRPLVKEGDKVLILATDGVWERASGDDCLRWVRNFFCERVAEAERRKNRRVNQVVEKLPSAEDMTETARFLQSEGAERDLFERNDLSEQQVGRKRDLAHSPSPSAKRRRRGRKDRIGYNVADVIVRRVLNKVRRTRNISSLQALMSLPPGRARRSKHDDITSSVVDLSAFVS